MTTQTRLRVAIALRVAIVFIGATGFHYIEGWPWFDGRRSHRSRNADRAGWHALISPLAEWSRSPCA